jgi:hypothetical protein
VIYEKVYRKIQLEGRIIPDLCMSSIIREKRGKVQVGPFDTPPAKLSFTYL